MKKYSIWAISIVLVMALCISRPIAAATVEAEACESGVHVWLWAEDETDYGGYGGRAEFDVQSCEFYPDVHKHYYVTGRVIYVYYCMYCEAKKTETTTYRDYELGEQCPYDFSGR